MGEHASTTAFCDPASQPVLSFLGSPERLLVDGQRTGGEFAVLEAVAERGHSAPRHRHRRATESFIVLDGELLIEAGGQRHVAGPGSVAVLPRDQVHTFLVVSAAARYLTLHTPAGFEAFVRDVSDLAAGGAPGRQALAQLAAGHGIEITGPGLTLGDAS